MWVNFLGHLTFLIRKIENFEEKKYSTKMIFRHTPETSHFIPLRLSLINARRQCSSRVIRSYTARSRVQSSETSGVVNRLVSRRLTSSIMPVLVRARRSSEASTYVKAEYKLWRFKTLNFYNNFPSTLPRAHTHLISAFDERETRLGVWLDSYSYTHIYIYTRACAHARQK